MRNLWSEGGILFSDTGNIGPLPVGMNCSIVVSGPRPISDVVFCGPSSLENASAI